MIVHETIKRDDGVNLIKTYSDAGYLLLQNETGAFYSEAVDVENGGYTYTETETASDETVTAEQVLDILMGGDGNG